MDKLQISASQVLQKFFDKANILGFIVETPTEEVQKTFSETYFQEAQGFTTRDMTEAQAYETAKIALRIRLNNFIVTGLLARKKPPEIAKFLLCDKLSVNEEVGEDKPTLQQSLDLRVLDNPQRHNGGHIWMDDEYLYIGFN